MDQKEFKKRLLEGTLPDRNITRAELELPVERHVTVTASQMEIDRLRASGSPYSGRSDKWLRFRVKGDKALMLLGLEESLSPEVKGILSMLIREIENEME